MKELEEYLKENNLILVLHSDMTGFTVDEDEEDIYSCVWHDHWPLSEASKNFPVLYFHDDFKDFLKSIDRS